MSSLYRLGGKALGGMDAERGEGLCVARLAQNLYRATSGCTQKRNGYQWLETVAENVAIRQILSFGAWEYFYSADTLYRRNGDTLQQRACVVYDMRLVGEKLMIFTHGAWLVAEQSGKVTLLTPDGVGNITNDFSGGVSAFKPTDKTVYVPLIRAASSPGGKGKAVLPQNLISPQVKESFVYTASDKEAKRNRFSLAVMPSLAGTLPSGELDEAQKELKKSLLSQSAYLELRLEETDEFGNVTHYWKKHSWTASDNINETDGAFWVNSIHQKALSFDGDDNVRITYLSADTERLAQAKKLFNSDTFALFGVAGLKDRLFAASGNRVRYSGMDQPLYFGTLQYFDIGQSDTVISVMAGEESVMSILTDRGAWRIAGRAEESLGEYALDASFAVSSRLPSPIPAGRDYCIAGGELLFYSREGLCAITPSGVLDERCVEVRSGRLEALLRKENPRDIRLAAYGDYIYLGGKNGMYLLDVQRPVKPAESRFSGHGYEGYFWDGAAVDCFVKGETFSFIENGERYALGESFRDEKRREGVFSYSPVVARWESGLIGDVFRCNQLLRLAAECEGDTAMRVRVTRSEDKRLLCDYDGRSIAFRYDGIHYPMFSYGNRHSGVWASALHIRHARGVSLCFENDIEDMPWRLKTFILEYK